MNLDDRIRVEISVGSLASLIAGWYFMDTGNDIHAVPSEVFIELAKRLVPFLKNWHYESMTIEEWIRDFLVVAPIVFFSDEKLEELKQEKIYFEYPNGNVILVVSGVIT